MFRFGSTKLTLRQKTSHTHHVHEQKVNMEYNHHFLKNGQNQLGIIKKR